MRNFIETIKAMGAKGVIAWFKRLFLSISLLEFIAYSVYWLVSIEAISKLVLIAIPVIAVMISAIDTIITDKEEIEEEEEKEEN